MLDNELSKSYMNLMHIDYMHSTPQVTISLPAGGQAQESSLHLIHVNQLKTGFKHIIPLV